MPRIAFVTCSTKPAIAPDDDHVVKILETRNVTVVPAPWDHAGIDWNSFDLVVLRSCWNYHYQPQQFEGWLREMEQHGVKLCNPPKVIRWNMHKGYLSELQSKGVRVPPTVWLKKGEQVDATALLRSAKWGRVVIKPAISATAFQTFVFHQEDAQEVQDKLQALLNERDLLIQAFVPEVQQAGEWSLLFFDKQFSHAVLKRPASGDFRVQNDFGGTSQKLSPPPSAIEAALRIVGFIDSPLLYTRVDGIMVDGHFLLMELELIEPVLFLAEDEMARTYFTDAILKRL